MHSQALPITSSDITQRDLGTGIGNVTVGVCGNEERALAHWQGRMTCYKLQLLQY